MYKIYVLPKAQKQYLTIIKTYPLIEKSIDELKNFPKISNIKKLKGFNNYYRLRSGKYRIVFIVDEGKKHIYIVKIEKRSKMYRDL